MSWLRRLSRDRASKGEQDLPMPIRPGSFQGDNHNTQSLLYKDTQYSSTPTSQDKLHSYRAPPPLERHFGSPHQQQQQLPPGTASDATVHTSPSNLTSAPDPLTKAFNEAIKPYIDQIESLKNELEDMTLHIQQLEDERADMHAWIDKRGLRAGEFIKFLFVLESIEFRLIMTAQTYLPRLPKP